MTNRQRQIADYGFILDNLDRGSTISFVGPTGLPETVHEAMNNLVVLMALEMANPGGE